MTYLESEFQQFQQWKAAKAAAHPEARIGIAEVRAICGGVSVMTIHRWLKDADLGFPAPAYINRRRYWLRSEIVAWLESRGES